MRLGVERLWCPETIDGQVATGIDARSITHGDPAQVRVDIGTRYHSKLSADGRWVAAASYGPRVRIFDNHTGTMKFDDDPEDAYDSLAFSHDGTRIVGTAEHAFVWTADGRYGAVTTHGMGGLCMWPMPDIVVADLARGRAILRFHDGVEDITRVATISRNSRWLALSDEAGIRVMPATPLPTWITPPVIARWPAHYSLEFGDGDRGHQRRRRRPARRAADRRGAREQAPDTRDGATVESRWPVRRRARAIGAFAIAPDGERIAVSDGATIVIATLPSRSR